MKTFLDELKHAIELNRDFVQKNKLKAARDWLKLSIKNFHEHSDDGSLRDLNGAWSRARFVMAECEPKTLPEVPLQEPSKAPDYFKAEKGGVLKSETIDV